MEMARELRETGTIEYQVRVEYWLTRNEYQKNENPIRAVYDYDYYEEAKEYVEVLRNLWENGKLGYNASVELVRVVKTEEVMTWFS